MRSRRALNPPPDDGVRSSPAWKDRDPFEVGFGRSLAHTKPAGISAEKHERVDQVFGQQLDSTMPLVPRHDVRAVFDQAPRALLLRNAHRRCALHCLSEIGARLRDPKRREAVD